MTGSFDTSSLSGLLNGDERVLRALASLPYDRLIVPLAADAELKFGFHYGSRYLANIANYNEYQEQFKLSIVMPDQEAGDIYAEVAAWAKKNGIAISNNDLWIAATSIRTSSLLITLDDDFRRLPQVRCIDL